jgi:type IX secretion system PorP/SprF family membrane protein
MQKYLFIFLFYLLTGTVSGQHLPVYSLYMFNGLSINPAYAGSSKALAVMLHYRKQWTGFENAPTTYTLMADSPLRNKKINIGAVLSYDHFGITSRTDYMQSFTFRVPLNKTARLAVGLQGGLVYQRMNWASAEAPADDQAFVNLSRSTWFPKLGGGIYFNTNKSYIGISIPQVVLYKNTTGPDSGQYYTSQMYYLNAGYDLNVVSNVVFKTSFLLKYIKNSPAQLDINGMFSYKRFITAGVSYRTGNALIFLLEAELNQLRIGYAYDYYLNTLRNYNSGSHELMLKYVFKYNIRTKDPRNFQ